MNEICIPFRHTSEEIISNVMSSFQNELIVQRWIDCAEDALACCRNVLHQYIDEGILSIVSIWASFVLLRLECMFIVENSCPPTWDGWTCFERATAGSIIKKQCSPYSYIAQPPRCLR